MTIYFPQEYLPVGLGNGDMFFVRSEFNVMFSIITLAAAHMLGKA
jgi:hypothetical protein